MGGRRIAAGAAAFLISAAGIDMGVQSSRALEPSAAPAAPQKAVGPKDCSRTSVGFTPLSDLKGGEYEGYKGGLYPGGNKPPKKYRAIGMKKARAIRPRNDDGQPAPKGKIVLLSIGMSNTKGEFEVFEDLAAKDGSVDDSVMIINGAKGGQEAETIRDPNARYWTRVENIVRGKAGSLKKVQVIWLKEAIARPDEDFPDDAERLQGALSEIVDILRKKFKQLRIIYVSSRIYAGYATRKLNPEPYAYQSGFAVKWLIRDQIRKAPGTRPWLAWGPYLWADGMEERSDGLIWECDDLADDGTHPSESGKQKVAEMLLDFLKTAPTAKSWFVD
ncbi:MAG TPA: hypothetical protein VFA00_11265 [Actinomycetota bacterium]|nr:hypothetical protein [Actinomycetota bacterium]